MYVDTASATATEQKSTVSVEDVLQCFPTRASLASALDHTLLRPDATRDEVLRVAREAGEHRFACAMVNPAWIVDVAGALRGTGVRVGTVIGFPLGASLPATKQEEALAAARAGALDLDMVIHIGALRSGLHEVVLADMRALAEIAHGEGAILKVILETCLLSNAEKETAARLCLEAGADFVKTSTGFSRSGATADDVALLRRTVGDRCGVKASGGLRSLDDAVRMTLAGASRIGASASVAILDAYRVVAGSQDVS